MMEFNDIIRNAASLPTTEIAADVNKALTANGCVVLTAPPGAGKSTLLPLTVMAGFLPSDGKILMLEPRRLAARQVAERMADMLLEHTGGSVGYRVRFENRVSEYPHRSDNRRNSDAYAHRRPFARRGVGCNLR